MDDRGEVPSAVGHSFRDDVGRLDDDLPYRGAITKELGDTVLNFDPLDVDEISLAIRETDALERDAGQERAFDAIYLEISGEVRLSLV